MQEMNSPVTSRSTLRRIPERSSHHPAVVNEILDAGFLAHIGFTVNGQPFVIPTLYGREGQKLFIHGSAASGMLRALETGLAVCLTVTLVDGVVLARSAFNHSMNYRSVVVFGTARSLDLPARKLEALRVISEHLVPGRWVDVRGPSERELKATTVLEMSIDEASAKIRNGPPEDDEEDYALSHWAGLLPLSLIANQPVSDPRLAKEIALPLYLRSCNFLERSRAGSSLRDEG